MIPAVKTTTPFVVNRPEVLAPAGTREMMHAAIQNGADAVYFGLQQMNARLRAGNFTIDELPETMAWLHTHGVRGYVTLNTLVFSEELDEARDVLIACSDAGVDAVLVQDLGLAVLAARLVPDLPVHASTQMTLSAPESVKGAEALGLHLERVVAPRELNLRELDVLRRNAGVPIEAFVHGALCVAYSGQCLTSEALGGRSANRGECAQACRLPYDLVVDGEHHPMEDLRYVLSPKDLAAYEDVSKLARAGICSLKIEGRLKSPEYVAATVQAYREAIDTAVAHNFADQSQPMPDETRHSLEMTFSRGFTGGFVHKTDHQAVVEGRYPKKRGLFLGRVIRVTNRGVLVNLEEETKPGDGVVFDNGHPEANEQGGRIYTVEAGDKKTETLLSFGGRDLDLKKIQPGDRLWKTSDPAIEKKLAASFNREGIGFHRPLDMKIFGKAGLPLSLELRDENGIGVTVHDDAPADIAERRPLTSEVLADQLGRLGDTPFVLRHLEVDLADSVMVPFSRLNKLRRDGIDALQQARLRNHASRRINVSALEDWETKIINADGCHVSLASDNPGLSDPSNHPGVLLKSNRLSVLCRTLEQVETAAHHPDVNAIYTDFEDIRLHREARKLVPPDGPRFIPSTLRVMKPGEAPFAKKLLETQPDALLVRSLAAWQVLREAAPELPMIADYALNIANHLSAHLLKSHGFERLTPSYDLNIDQLIQMLSRCNPEWFEITIHQHLPMFHMEHCVFCRYLSTGTDFTNCGRPCETHSLKLRDRMGFEHPVKADAGCRNTVYNAVAQSGSAYLDRMLRAGATRFRIEFIDEKALAVSDAINAYIPAIHGETNGQTVWRQLKAASRLGVTRGSLDS